MALQADDLAFLASPRGAALLAQLAAEDLADAHTLRLIDHLRRTYSAGEARAALELARLRQTAVTRFGADAGRLYFTREALEQASHPRVRAWRAAMLGVAGQTVVDACCGIGTDALALAAAGAAVTGLDLDPLRVALARLNADALGLMARFEVRDVTAGLPDADLIFFDPARRAGERRLHHVEAYLPPLSTVEGWSAARIAVKLSPGVELAQVARYRSAGAGLTFVSVEGELKEALLTLGQALPAAAVLLAAAGDHVWPALPEPEQAPLATPRAWLIEPDAALLRAGQVQQAAALWGAAMLDPTIAYLTADDFPQTPWLRAWRVRDWFPFHLKRLRAYLRERGVGRVTVKKRGSPLTPETLIPQLRLRGDDAATLVLTRCVGEPVVMVCDEQPES